MDQQLIEKIEKLLQAKYAEPDFAEYFTVEIKLGQDRLLEVFVDSDEGIDFVKCKLISRYLESILDENKWLTEQYTLEVSSPGVDRPLKFFRQYPKHIGRTLEVVTEGNTYEGKFISLEDETITLEYEVKYKEGKKNMKKITQKAILFSAIEKAEVVLVF